MLISVKVLKKYWGVNPRTIVHVGAHNAEELENYASAGWGPVTWIEAQPLKVQALANKLPKSHKLFEAAVWDSDGVALSLNVMTNTESTSLLNLGTHAKEHPTVTFSHTIPVTTKTLSTLLQGNSAPDLLALDIQGVELRAIKGFGDQIEKVKWIYCEVNRAELYEGCCLIEDIDQYLKTYGFKRSVTRWTIHNWGDALYQNTNLVPGASLTQKLQQRFIYTTWKLHSALTFAKSIIRRPLK